MSAQPKHSKFHCDGSLKLDFEAIDDFLWIFFEQFLVFILVHLSNAFGFHQKDFELLIFDTLYVPLISPIILPFDF